MGSSYRNILIVTSFRPNVSIRVLFASKTMATLRIRRTSRKQVVERAANLLFLSLSLSSVFLPRHWRIIVKSDCQVLTVTSRINNPVGENVFYGN